MEQILVYSITNRSGHGFSKPGSMTGALPWPDPLIGSWPIVFVLMDFYLAENVNSLGARIGIYLEN